ncbi:hypothetical protein [Roseovarius sp. MMSF_3281]|uniref:hypothetical protein n=1 Tax=Roseovarius sp. MMSF_3281 TaxID=3046694 RepID=UPI00273D200C|nr:hypothetical protein [Roseovarius sp. MMSF_3281]
MSVADLWRAPAEVHKRAKGHIRDTQETAFEIARDQIVGAVHKWQFSSTSCVTP